LGNFYLAGGTALALQIGHRISTDLDWFSSISLLLASEREQIRQALTLIGDPKIAAEEDGQLHVQFVGTDVSFLYQHHPLLFPTVAYQGLNLASPADIGLMKLAAVNSRGTRRDFVDLYCLRETAPLEQLLELAKEKYADRPSFLAVTARALAYFEDAEQQPMPQMLQKVKWAEVRAYCERAAHQLARRHGGLD